MALCSHPFEPTLGLPHLPRLHRFTVHHRTFGNTKEETKRKETSPNHVRVPWKERCGSRMFKAQFVLIGKLFQPPRPTRDLPLQVTSLHRSHRVVLYFGCLEYSQLPTCFDLDRHCRLDEDRAGTGNVPAGGQTFTNPACGKEPESHRTTKYSQSSSENHYCFTDS